MSTIAPNEFRRQSDQRVIGVAAPSTLTVESVAFHALSDTEWRVSDTRVDPSDVSSLLGFVARQGDFYFTTAMSSPSASLPMRSLEEVARHFCELHARRGR
ncbi:hypothetical protein [Marisediminicola sp. LYQ134]|uniref:hypothetical protein n=1 Tax=unclassified Marisediminicola TaxID=2618316 RepID=UPI003982F61E